MPHVSRKKLKPRDQKVYSDTLEYTLSNLKPSEVKHVLNVLITKTEHTMLYKRLIILLLLSKNLGFSEIAEATNTTRETVARIRLQLLEIPDESRKFVIEKVSKWSNIRLLKQIIKRILNIDVKWEIMKNIRPF